MRCSMTIIGFVFMITEINAYNCEIALSLTNVTVISEGWCTYLNYHLIMLAIFGPSAVFFTLKAVFHAKCMDDEDAAENSIQFAFVNACISLGLEFSLVILYTFLLLVQIIGPMVQCMTWVSRATSHNTARIVPVIVMAAETPITVAPVEPINISIVIMDITTLPECSICLSSDDGDWAVTECGHNFHEVCIKAWANRSCPLCRNDLTK
jgi:uncharacterized membrane protein